MSETYVCAVDVGTASARAGVFDPGGRQLSRAERAILVHQPRAGHAEHDSEDIWSAVCSAVRAACDNAGVDAAMVAGICFGATCSLVVRDGEGGKLSVSADGDGAWDTISWFDHRALGEAEECTSTGHAVLEHVGGVMSPEMQTPKLMWLKRSKPRTWAAAQNLFDLADFLTWRATGSTSRSICTLACKWTYLPREGGWSPGFFSQVGLDDLIQRLPHEASTPGASVGRLTPQAARDLGLTTGCSVAAGMVDAYAGLIGAIGAHAQDGDRHVALIGGTSSCLMWLSRKRRFVPSIWGPYPDVALPGFWVSEGGQSATGAMLDYIISIHRGDKAPTASDHEAIVRRVKQLRVSDPDLGAGVHINPDFNGNRSPLADPRAKGAIFGLDLDRTFDGLCAIYWRACVAIALGVRDIVEHLRKHGQDVAFLHIAGGHGRNPLLMELYPDVTGVKVVDGGDNDAVLLGNAICATVAAGRYASIEHAAGGMKQGEALHEPNPQRAPMYNRDYRALRLLQETNRRISEL